MPEPEKLEQLFAAKAVAAAFEKQVVKPLEDECKKEALKEFEEKGVDRRRSTLFGAKNAYLSVVAGTEGEDVERFETTDMNALMDWFEDGDFDTWRFAFEHIQEFAEWHFRNTGECPDGCHLIRYRSEGKKPYARISVNPDEVIPILRGDKALMKAVQLPMLEGGKDERPF